MASKKDGVLYTGVTNNLIRRAYEHRKNLIKGFTQKYFIHKLVYYEQTDSINVAIKREKQMKKWNRKWKVRIINEFNQNGKIYIMILAAQKNTISMIITNKLKIPAGVYPALDAGPE